MELSNFIVEAVLKQAVTDKIVVYGGRFQPFHKGHKKVYDALVSKFGSKNVYIATSDVQDSDKSPLSFNDKKEIATKLFGIPSSKFVKVKKPYQPVEILRGYDDVTTALIVAVGEKDDARLGGSYFKPYTNDKNLKGYAVNAYVYSELPSNSFGATDVRNMFRNNRMGGERKQKEFEKFFGKFDKAIYTKLIKSLNEASAAGSGYDEKTLDQLVDNPETGEKVKVRSALNYDKNHPAYRAAMAVVGKSGAKPQPNQQQRPAAKPQNRNAGEPMTGTNNRVGAKPTPGANNQNGTNSTNKTQKPLEKPLTNPAQAQEKPQQSQPQQTVSVDKVRKEIPNFKVSDKSDIGKVSVKQRREVSMKIDDLAKKSAEAKANGEKAPNFNLCDITIPGTNLYCGGNKGIPREQMPQFKGKPQPGSIADGLPKDKDGEVDTEAMFKKMLEDKGIKVSEPTQVPADQLKATQTELVGPKVAGMSKALDADPNHPGITAPIYVSSDGYVLDGHHRWAAITSHEIVSGREAMMNVRVIDMPIDQLVKESNEFAQKIGVQAKAADANKETPTNGMQPTKGTTDATDSGDGKVNTTANQNSKVTTSTIKNNINKMPNEAKQVFKTGQHKANSPLRSYIGKTINNTMQNLVPSIKQEMEHLGHTYQFAGEGLASLFDGKVVSDKGKDAIKKMAQVLSISSIKSIDNKDKHSKALMQHLGKHLAAHIADDIITNGVGKVAQNAGVEIDGDNDKFVEWFGLYFAQQMKDGKIPLDVWESTVQDYMKDSEDGKVDGDTNTVAEVIIEVDEDINVDVDKGDVVLTGKFKNKKTVVKDISKDQHGMPTINGRQATTFRKVEEGIINEGGAYGHMNHPFDVRMNLSFGDLKAIVNNALDGNLGVVREKTDGQALAISWKNGRLISARNKGHLANAGANAMDINGVASKFGGRGGLTDAYNFAMKDLENAIRGLSKAQKDKIFKEGKVFVNLEVIWPTSVNVIPYNQALLVFHNAVEYNEAGNPISKIDGAESILGGMIKQINAHVQSKYTIQGPPIVKLPKTKQLSSQKSKFKGMISKLQSEFGLTDKDGVADYHQAWWENFVDNSKKKISALEKAGLVKRWAFDNKSMRIGDIKDDKAREWAEGIDKGPKTTIMSGNLRKFEDIFLGVGAEVLSFMGSVLTAQPDKALQSMRAELESTANQIMNGGTITQIKKLEKELSRLNSIGGFEKIVPSEGIVFSYKGNAYKLTGAFAPLNQILGIFKFSR
jgi:hypothetical protein